MPEDAGSFVYRFGRCELQPRERRLLIEGTPAALAPRAFDVLLALVERAGHLVTKEELCALVWPKLVVEENNLQQQVSALRRVLGTDAIATVPGHGYRFERQPQRVELPRAQVAPGRLPQPLTSFIGREREVGEACRLLESSRLLTLVGMGGVGKTRLSLRLASAASGAYPDGAWFVDLAPLRDPSLVAHQVAQALGVQEQAGQSPQNSLRTFLRVRHALIVLDNCEHLIGACANLCDALLHAAPALRILATSREALHVPGEQLYVLLPMEVPDPADIAEAASCDAVQLFIDRARLHQSAFSPGAREQRVLAEVCARLEGIPLAIELAAARLRTLSIADIDERLRDRFRLLASGARVLDTRQQTLRALLDWSYDLLGPAECLLCDRLSVFAGGFDLAAAEAVCGGAPLDAADVLEVLSSLADKSLLLVEQRADHARYRMLETMREYAHQKLEARGELEATKARHCLHYLAVAKAANQESAGPRGEWAERIEADLDNLRAAVACALEGGVDAVVAVKLEVALLRFRLLRGHVGEGRRNIDAALALPSVRGADVAHAHALYAGAGLAAAQGEHALAARLLESCLGLRRGIGNRTDVAATLSTLALVRLQAGDAAGARDDETQALALFRELADSIGEAISLLHLGQIEMHVERDSAARERFDACLAIARSVEHAETANECERMLGELALHGGDVAAARARFASSLDACGRAGDKRGEALSQWGLARADLAAGDTAHVSAKLEAALHAFRAFGMKAESVACLEDFAAVAQAGGDHARAVRLFAAALGARERLNLGQAQREQRVLSAALGLARSALGDEAFRAAMREGREAGLDDEAVRVPRAAPCAVSPPRS
jgi:predicted ATPase/DNA-binding winged helix-turn-helix (wHTH) protein